MIGYDANTTLDAMLELYLVFREARWDFLEKRGEERGNRRGQCSPTFPVASSICEACEETPPGLAIVFLARKTPSAASSRGQTLESI